MLEIVNGDLLEAKEKYMAHVCNCVSQKAMGIAKDIFDKFPYANTYINRTVPDNLATIKILGNGQDQRYIINMFSMAYPGKPRYPDSKLDGTLAREKYFHKCLLKIAKIENLESIAFPWRIGCNLGGGDWNIYLGTINNFAQYIYSTQGAKTIIYRKDNAE